jgi:ABC-2 type transport system permease protein
MDLIRSFALLISFFFIGKLFKGVGTHSALAAYGGDYFQFVFLGIAFSEFMTTTLSSVRVTTAFERENGTLETILLTPTSFTRIAVGRTLVDLSLVTGKVAVFLLFGALFLQADLSHANWVALLPTLTLTVTACLGFGMFSAGFFLLTREVSPLERIMGWSSRLLAVVYFPIAMLPEWLKQVSECLPLTYTLDAVRKSLIQGASVQAIAQELGVLLVFSVILLPAGLFFFRWAFNQARLQGSLGFQH